MTRLCISLLLLIALAGGAWGPETPTTTYPRVLGDGVDPMNHAHYPVRLLRPERVDWEFGEGRHTGAAHVGPDGAIYVNDPDTVRRISGAERPLPPPAVARDLLTVADDFIVDLWVNGEKVAQERRTLLAENFGATTERVEVNLHPGDWIVFHVVANRLRWGGASYFGVHARDSVGRAAFVSTTEGGWSACDDPEASGKFIRERDFGRERAAVAPARPWADAGGQWRAHLGEEFVGTPVWGEAPSTWIKFVVPSAEVPPLPQE